MRVVTTCSKKNYEDYAHRILDGWKFWPNDAELVWYVEGFHLPEDRPANVREIDVSTLQGLNRFKDKHYGYAPPSFLFDVVRFSHKVFAACDALMTHKGLGIWMDADCVTQKTIPYGYLNRLLPGGNYMAMFKRRGMYTETGFWLMDCSHEQHQAFLQAWLDWYESDNFKTLANWTDCETLDATVRAFEKRGLIRTASLSGEHDKFMHPMAKVELSQYIDHCKGPRKALGYSPEKEAV